MKNDCANEFKSQSITKNYQKNHNASKSDNIGIFFGLNFFVGYLLKQFQGFKCQKNF